MEIFYNLDHPLGLASPAVLTIGNFDGIHLGHRALFDRMAAIANAAGSPKGIITFENHPAEVLRPETPVCLLSTLQHKIQLIQELKIDFLVLLKFTRDFASQTPEDFLNKVRAALPFNYLILGYDATLGKNKSGDRERVKSCLQAWGAMVEYIPPFKIGSQLVSSSAIRDHIRRGELKLASDMLGRPFSILATVIPGLSKGKQMGFPTLNIDPAGVCLPPLGVYAIQIKYQGKLWKGVANLGMAPTIRQDKKTLLEVHLFDFEGDLYGANVEIIFHQYLRQEKSFSDIKQLQEQIQKDIGTARGFFNAYHSYCF